jgi:hypothetical protein
MTIIRLILLSFVLSVNSCTSIGISNHTEVSIVEDIRFSYTGRGAGVALMTTMGPAGIAIGAAIDEGIRKDLETSALAAGFNIVDIVSEADIKADRVLITGYGMKDVRGSDGLMFPYLTLTVTDNGTESERLLDYQNLQNLNSSPALTPLSMDTYKTDGKRIIESFRSLLVSQ